MPVVPVPAAPSRLRRLLRLLPLTSLVVMVASVLAVRIAHPRRVVPRLAASGGAGGTGSQGAGSTGLDSMTTEQANAGFGAASRPAREPVAPIDHGPTMLHGDARHTHRARGRGPTSAHERWSFKAGGPVQGQVTASPDEQTLYVASLDGSITALDRDGKPRFRVPLGDRAYGAPCVGPDGVVYVGSDNKRFYAIRPDGRVLWKLETASDVDTGAAIDGAGRIAVASGRTLFVVRPKGDVAFRFNARGKIFAAPAVTSDGQFVFGSQDHHAYAVAADGKLAWSLDLGADVDGAPAIGDDGRIFFGTDGDEVVGVTADGHVAWRTLVGGFVRGTLAVARNGDVLAGVYGPAPRQVRLAPDDGRVLGYFSVQGTGAREFGVHGAALEDDAGTLYFGAQDDAVYAVDARGKLLFRFATQGDVDAPLTLLGDGSLVVASDDGTVTLLGP